MQMMFVLVGGGLSGVLGVIGILNFVNSVMTAMIARRRELAMLESIGMTQSQLQKMLCLEGLYYILFTVSVSVTVGSVLIYFLTGLLGNTIGFFAYHFTVKSILYVLPWLIVIAVFVPFGCYRLMGRQSVVERLRQAE